MEQLLSTHLHVECWDWDRYSRNDSLGNSKVDLSQVPNLRSGHPCQISVLLQDQQATPGEIFLELQWHGDSSYGSMGARPYPAHAAPATPPYRGSNSYGRSAGGSYGGGSHRPPTNGGVPSRVQATFATYDVNNSGFLDYKELREVSGYPRAAARVTTARSYHHARQHTARAESWMRASARTLAHLPAAAAQRDSMPPRRLFATTASTM